jgi:Secretion system C-terminal sorting domain/Dockerin type I domain
MTTMQGFVITEDHVLMTDGDVDLGPDEDTTITLYPQGTTLRLEVAQVPNHPGRSHPSASYEACTTDNNGNISIGYVNQFPADDANVFVSIDAQESTASAVSTIHKAYPKGYGDEHFIKANEDLDYHILFENNTTDTVYTVIVRDSLSAWLDVASIRRGAASHDYTFDLLGSGVAEFIFSDIQLAPGESGFIKYTIQQLPDNPNGTYIENTACIAFDYGFYNKTNTTFHQIESDFVPVAANTQISGSIVNENNEAVAQVEIWNNGQSSILTNDNGDYTIENQPAGMSYTISPSKNSNLTNGVDAADLYLIQQHLLGNELLDSPYKILAADVNNSGAVTTMDVLNLQQVILLLADEFPNNSSWRFVKTPYDFEEEDNPFGSIFPEAFTLTVPLMNNVINFTAIKIGDVDISHNPLELIDAEEKDKHALQVNDLRLEKGKTYEVPVYTEAHLAALQFALQWDQSALSFQGVETDATTICRSDNFGYRFLRAGVITACWFDQNAVESNQPNQNSPTMLFRMRFTAQKDGLLSSFISLSPHHVEGLAYERKEDLLSKDLKRKLTYLQFNATDQQPAKGRALALEIFPNPLTDDFLWINYSLATDTDITITVHNNLGQGLETILSTAQHKGTYTYQWNSSALPEGAYYIQLHTDEAAPLLCKFVKVN